MVSGNEVVSPLITLGGTIIAIVAIALIPGKTALKEGRTERYFSWGRVVIYLLAVVLLAFAGYMFYIWFQKEARDAFTTGNLAVFLVLGIGLIANNVWLTKRIQKSQDENAAATEEVHEVEEQMDSPAKKPAPKKGGLKKKVRKAPALAPQVHLPPPIPVVSDKPRAVKKAKSVEPVVRTKAKMDTDEELIEPAKRSTKKKKCPSCDTPIDHHDGECPVCGESLVL